MNSKHYVGQNVSKFAAEGMTRPVDGIVLVVDEEHEYRAGNQLGEVLEIQCPYGTQAMADALLESLKNRSYMGYTAENAVIDPQAELGDGVTVNGHYTLLANRKIKIGSGRMAEMSAPGESELDHEYKSGESYERRIERKLAKTESSITKTAEEIRAEVGNQITGLSSSIDIKLNGITQQVTGLDGRITTAQQTADKISWLVKSGTDSSNFEMTDRAINLVAGSINLSGYVTFSSLSNKNDQTKINGGNIISSTITADKLSVTDLSAIGAKIGGWSINSSGIVYESSDKLHRVTLRIVDSGTSGTGVFYVGSRKSASDSYSYPFRVNIDGTCSATAFTMSGSSKVDGASVTDSTISSSTLSGTNTNTGTISGGTISKPSITGGTLGGSTGGTYIGTVSGGTLSSCGTGGTTLNIAGSGSLNANGTTPQISGTNVFVAAGHQSYSFGPSNAFNTPGNINCGGTLSCTGAKPRTILTAHFGSRQLDAFETALPTFSDYGEGLLDESGVCYIVIDTILAETVNDAYLPTVFLTKYGEGDIWVEHVDHDIVTVRGTPELRFSWETRYAQGKLAVERLRVKDYDEPDLSGERDYSTEANIDLEVNSIDYAQEGYEYYLDFERSLAE